jgi:hypothetical protein
MSAAAPETTAAANDVPDIHMYPGAAIRSGWFTYIQPAVGVGPFM